MSKSIVGIIGDTHCPALLDGYLDFTEATFDQWNVDRVVHIGDLVDNCALSFHLKKPCLKDPMREYDLAMTQIDDITTRFPNVDLMLGNHDALPYRLADEIGVPEEMMKDPSEIWRLPDGWTVHGRYEQLVVDEVIYQHGDCGRSSAVLNMKNEYRSVVQGHHHSKFGVEFLANRHARTFGMQVGCGVDHTHMAQEYGKKFNTKPVIGCGIVVNGLQAYVEPMILEEWS